MFVHLFWSHKHRRETKLEFVFFSLGFRRNLHVPAGFSLHNSRWSSDTAGSLSCFTFPWRARRQSSSWLDDWRENQLDQSHHTAGANAGFSGYLWRNSAIFWQQPQWHGMEPQNLLKPHFSIRFCTINTIIFYLRLVWCLICLFCWARQRNLVLIVTFAGTNISL